MELYLSKTPQKDGFITEYKCGLVITGSWATRLRKYRNYIKTPHAEYILKLESIYRKQKLLQKAIEKQDLNRTFGTGIVVDVYPNDLDEKLRSQKGPLNIHVEKTDDCTNTWVSILYNGYEMVFPKQNWDFIKKQTEETIIEFTK